ncbi:unnamed protein product [Rotaria socialis]|uniref:Uncharacterized protein n=1 Tax=Rotaria socialis TaxID=392032 RepID=A0A821PGB8_9BILA|nr:unnamed protein product [Rotaria socialis]
MSKNTGSNRISALKRLSKPSSLNNMNRGQSIGSKNSSVQDARDLLQSRNKVSFDARQLLSRQSSKILTKTIIRNNLLSNKKDIGSNDGKMVVITGLEDMKMKDGRLIPTTTMGSSEVEKKKKIFAVGPSTQGCVQIIYAKREHGEQAVAKYHNRLLDGQFMYVSLQQLSSYSTIQNSKKTHNDEQPTKENGASNISTSTADQPLKLNSTNNTAKKIVIDPAFIRQALFHPTNSTANPVQFQVKL